MTFRYVVTSTVVTDEVLYLPGGSVHRWAHQVGRELTAAVILHAPVNKRVNKGYNSPGPPGYLKSHISGEVGNTSLRIFTTTISVDAPYALAVIKGTGRIYSRSARSSTGQFTPIRGEDGERLGGMILPANFGIGRLLRQSVRGQRANPFLAEAFGDVSRRHSSLRGFSMTV